MYGEKPEGSTGNRSEYLQMKTPCSCQRMTDRLGTHESIQPGSDWNLMKRPEKVKLTKARPVTIAYTETRLSAKKRKHSKRIQQVAMKTM